MTSRKINTPLTKEQSVLMGEHYHLAERQTYYYLSRNPWCPYDEAYDVAVETLEYTSRSFKEGKGASFETYYINMANLKYAKNFELRKRDMSRGVKFATSLNAEKNEKGEEFESLFGENDEYEVERMAIFEDMKEILSEKEISMIYDRYVLGMEIRDISEKHGSINWRSSSVLINKALAKVKRSFENKNITLNELLA